MPFSLFLGRSFKMLSGLEFSQSLGREEKRAGKESSSPVSFLQHVHVHLYSHQNIANTFFEGRKK